MDYGIPGDFLLTGKLVISLSEIIVPGAFGHSSFKMENHINSATLEEK